MYGVDQYGSWAVPFTSLTVVATDATGNTIPGVSIGSDNTLIAPAGLVSGDVITVNGVTPNGLIESMNIKLDGTRIATGTTPVTPVTPVASTLTGTFGNLLGQTYANVTLPTGVTSVTAVTKNGTTLTSGTDYSVTGTQLSILNVLTTDTVTVTGSNGTVYTITH